MEKNRKRFLKMALALMLAVSAQTTLAQTQSDAAPAASKDADQRMADLEKQIDALRSEIAAMRSATSAPAAVATPDAAKSLVSTAAATPVPPPPLAGIATVLNGATVNGLVDTYYGYNVNQPANHLTGLRLFDANQNQFALNMVELGLLKTPDADNRLGYNVTLGFGQAMSVVNSSDPSFLQYLKESYVSYLAPVGKGLQIDAGKFVTPNGAEVIESNANWNYSRSILFNYAIPFYHFGLRGKYTFNDKFSVTGYVVNGWNNVIQNASNGYTNSGKTGGVSVGWNPTKKLSIAETWMGGPGATPLDGNNWRNLTDTVVTYTLNPRWTLMANVDYGRAERDATLGGAVDWSGIAGYVKYKFDPRWSVAGRYEYYNDHTGFTTGAAQHLQEVTGTIERRISHHLLSRFEFRHDMSNQDFFQKGGNNTPIDHQSTIAGGLIFVLEPAETE